MREKNQGSWQMGLFSLVDSSVSACFGQTPVHIWNFRENSLLNMNSRQMQLMTKYSTSVIVFVNEDCQQDNPCLSQTIEILNVIKSTIG